MKRDNQKITSAFIESAIKVIARDGFDKASTRNIARECDIADAYIYVYFKDKEELFSKAFQKVDTALVREIKKCLPILKQTGITNEGRLYFLFSRLWVCLCAHPDTCRFFIQYYYSPYYPKYSAQEHLVRWMPILDQMKSMFLPRIDVRATLRLVLNTMLGQAIKASGDISTEKDVIARNNYSLVLGMLSSCLSDK